MDWSHETADVVAALIEVGFDATLRKSGAKTGLAYAPTVGGPQLLTIRVVQRQIRQRDRNGTVVSDSTRWLLMGATGVVPEKKDFVRINGKDFEVVDVEPIAPGGVAIAYRLQLGD